ncbi:MAG: hypothetical protein HC852_07650 [Acaryochloridaceae cyanobacterium RU_4_10]|nr:hypothetical protein [Acaryochloridaceae cyanobacterium RU_4_10]
MIAWVFLFGVRSPFWVEAGECNRPRPVGWFGGGNAIAFIREVSGFGVRSPLWIVLRKNGDRSIPGFTSDAIAID